MKIATSFWTGVALLAMAQAAQAAPPKVSGKYALMIFTQCQAGFTTSTDNYMRFPSGSGPAVATLIPATSGELNISVGTLTFPNTPASSGIDATFEAVIVSGASLSINGDGDLMGTHTEGPPAGPYSFTNTIFTFTPGGEPAMRWTFRAGDIVAGGVARTLYMVRKENPKCVNAVIATKQLQ